jgi:hypothetical protein
MNTLITPRRHEKGVALATAPPPADQSRPEECRARAAECQGIADHWPDLIKQQYEALACQWRAVAEEVERRPGARGGVSRPQRVLKGVEERPSIAREDGRCSTPLSRAMDALDAFDALTA